MNRKCKCATCISGLGIITCKDFEPKNHSQQPFGGNQPVMAQGEKVPTDSVVVVPCERKDQVHRSNPADKAQNPGNLEGTQNHTRQGKSDFDKLGFHHKPVEKTLSDEIIDCSLRVLK